MSNICKLLFDNLCNLKTIQFSPSSSRPDIFCCFFRQIYSINDFIACLCFPLHNSKYKFLGSVSEIHAMFAMLKHTKQINRTFSYDELPKFKYLCSFQRDIPRHFLRQHHPQKCRSVS